MIKLAPIYMPNPSKGIKRSFPLDVCGLMIMAADINNEPIPISKSLALKKKSIMMFCMRVYRPISTIAMVKTSRSELTLKRVILAGFEIFTDIF